MRSLDDFDVVGRIGKGGFGHVLVVVARETGVHFALKVMDKSEMLRGNHKSSVSHAVAEKAFLQDASAKPHPFVVTLYSVFQDEKACFLLMSYAGGGDLRCWCADTNVNCRLADHRDGRHQRHARSSAHRSPPIRCTVHDPDAAAGACVLLLQARTRSRGGRGCPAPTSCT